MEVFRSAAFLQFLYYRADRTESCCAGCWPITGHLPSIPLMHVAGLLQINFSVYLLCRILAYWGSSPHQPLVQNACLLLVNFPVYYHVQDAGLLGVISPATPCSECWPIASQLHSILPCAGCWPIAGQLPCNPLCRMLTYCWPTSQQPLCRMLAYCRPTPQHNIV